MIITSQNSHIMTSKQDDDDFVSDDELEDKNLPLQSPQLPPSMTSHKLPHADVTKNNLSSKKGDMRGRSLTSGVSLQKARENLRKSSDVTQGYVSQEINAGFLIFIFL